MQKENPENSSAPQPVPDLDPDRFGRFSALRLIVIIIVSIFIAEIIAMGVVYLNNPLPYYLLTLIDAGSMVVLIFPILYRFSFHPLIQHIEKLEQAEKSLQLLSSVVEQTADTVVVTNFDGVIEYVNPAFEELTGYQKEEALGQTPRVLKSGLHDKSFYQKLWDTILSGQVFHSEITNRKKNGDVFHEVKTITPLRDGQGEITHFVATGKDITERRQAEERLRKAYDGLEVRVQERTEELQIANSELEDEINIRRRTEGALQQSEAMLRAVLDQMPSGVTVRDASTGEIILSNARSREIMGDLVDTTDQFAQYHGLHADGHPYRSEEWPVFRSIATGEKVDAEELELLGSDGARKAISISSAPIRDSQGQIISGVAVFHDITERKRTEARLHQLNRTLRALSNANQVMLRAASERQYLDDVCRIVVEDCGHSMVWIGYAQDDEEKSVRPVASAGFEAGYLETLNISWGDNERGHGPTGAAIRNGETSRCNNMLTDPQFAPWREQALKRGYASSLVLPLMSDGKAFGALSIYSREPDGFTKDEEVLLLELSGDLAYGIQAIRLQEAHALAEAELRRARDELEIRVQERTEELAAANCELSDEITERKEIERQLRIQTAAMESAANGIIITDSDGVILWANPAITQITGYEENDLIGQNTRIFNSGRHEADFYGQMWATILAGNVWHGETTNRRKDGGLYVEEQTITPVQSEDGELSHFIAIKQDVTERNSIYSQLEDSNRDLRNLTASERQQRFLAEGLVESSIVLNMSLDLHAVLDHIFEQTRHIIPYRMADIVLIEAGIATVVRQWGGEGRSEAKTIFENNSLQLRDFSIWEQICATKIAVMIPGTSLENRLSSYFGVQWIRSYL